MLRIALTTGEPAGIGPDLALALAAAPAAQTGQDLDPLEDFELVVVADPDLLRERARLLNLCIDLHEFRAGDTPRARRQGQLSVAPVALARACVAGTLDSANAGYVLDTLRLACTGCQQGAFNAMVTAPVQKSIINDAGIAFTGHTEFLAELTGAGQVVMMLATAQMRVALVTTHLALAQVAAAINADDLAAVCRVLNDDLRKRFGLSRPRIAVLGLNPHAGEGGHLGREEIEIIEPTLASLRRDGLDLLGPLPADTAFNPKVLRDCDVVLAMYHDQGLPVLKYAGFGNAANITLGLPIIRTSVDHGTALDLAGSGQADPGSLHYALRCALDMARAESNAAAAAASHG